MLKMVRLSKKLLSEIIPNKFHFIVIDGLNDLRIDIEQLKELKKTLITAHSLLFHKLPRMGRYEVPNN